MTWRSQAACRGKWPELDYWSSDKQMKRLCRETCKACPVSDECFRALRREYVACYRRIG